MTTLTSRISSKFPNCNHRFSDTVDEADAAYNRRPCLNGCGVIRTNGDNKLWFNGEEVPVITTSGNIPLTYNDLVERCGEILAATLDAQDVPMFSNSALRPAAEKLADLLNMLTGKMGEKCHCGASLVWCSQCGHRWCLDHSGSGLACPACGAKPE